MWSRDNDVIRCEAEMIWQDVKQRWWWYDKMWNWDDDVIRFEAEIMMWYEMSNIDDMIRCEAEMMW